MYILIKNDSLLGFSDKEELGYDNYEINMENYLEYLEKQRKNFTLLWNKKEKKIEAIKLENFEFINENGKIEKDTEAEKQYNNDTLLKLKKEKIQLKRDIADFEEFEEDTTYLKEQLKAKEAEIKELEEQLKKL